MFEIGLFKTLVKSWKLFNRRIKVLRTGRVFEMVTFKMATQKAAFDKIFGIGAC